MAVVLLHGLFQGLGHLEEIPFPSPKQAVVIDMLGYGSHAHAVAPETLEAQADHVVGEMDRLGISTLDGVLDSGIPVHLMAGERSRSGWVAPDAFIRRAASFTVQPGVGHMMPLEDPETFLSLVASRVG